MLPRALMCIVLFFFMVTLTGCWDNKDINKRMMPVVMGICKNQNDLYQIIVQLPGPEKEGATYIESSSGSISNAVEKIRTTAEKAVDLLHIRLFLICEKTAQEEIEDIIDYTVQANDISIKGLLGIARGDFEQLMQHDIQSTSEPSSYDFFNEEAGWTPYITVLHLWEAYRDIHSYTADMVIPILTKGTDTMYHIEGSAIMRKDKFVREMSIEETLIYNLFQDRYRGGTIEVSEGSSVLIKNVTIDHKAKWDSSGPNLQSHLKLNVAITENMNNDSEEAISQKLEKIIKERGQYLSDKLQQEKADSLGTGQYFRGTMTNKQMKNWKETWFAKLNHEITVDINVINSILFKEQDT